MYDTITSEQWVIGLVISLLVFGGLVWLLWHYFPHDARARDDMSSTASAPSSEKAGDKPVSHQVPKPVFVSAEPNTDDTAPVPGAGGASVIDTEARAIIRANLIADLLDSGLLTNRDKAICQAFRCSKAASTRPDAPFQVALRLVEQHRTKRQPEYVGEMIERVHREVASKQA